MIGDEPIAKYLAVGLAVVGVMLMLWFFGAKALVAAILGGFIFVFVCLLVGFIIVEFPLWS